jgi:SPP1 family phage portal protein
VAEIGNQTYHGRRTIYSYTDNITDENICEVLQRAYAVHSKNRREIDYLHKYHKGKQPILNRKKTVRPEITNRIVENHALEIDSFKVGYMFGEPVQYVRRGDCEIAPETESEGVATLNELMQLDNKAGKDRELAEWINKCGLGFRLVVPTEQNTETPFETFVLDPRNTFIVRSPDFQKKPLLGVTYVNRYGFDGKDFNRATIYSDTQVWKVDFVGSRYQIVEIAENPIGIIPIFEYRNNPDMIGSFEPVLPLCDALNVLSSNCVDSIEQTVQNLIWFNNCEISDDQFQKLKDKGAIMTKSEPGNPANIQVITNVLSQTETQTTKDDIYQKMLTIASVPDRRASAGGNTGQALIIGEGWIMAESAAKAFEPLFIGAEKQMLKAVLKICQDRKNSPPEVKQLKLHDIDVKFTRNKTDNLLVKTQALTNLLQSGIHPRIAIEYCGLFSDPEQVYQDSRETLANIAAGNADSEDINALTKKADLNSEDPLTDEVFALIDKLGGNGGEQNGDS